MIQNFQEETCFILDTMKGNKIVKQIPFSKELKSFFLYFEERGKVSITIFEAEKVT